MADKEEPQAPVFNVTNQGDVGEQNLANKIQKGTVIEGDVAGDVVEQQNKTEIAGDMHGDIHQTNVKDGDFVTQLTEAAQVAMEDLSTVFKPLEGDDVADVPPASQDNSIDMNPEGIPSYDEEGNAVPVDDTLTSVMDGPDEEQVELLEIEAELHPQTLLTEAYGMLDTSTPEPTEEEAASWGDRFKKMCGIAGSAGAAAVKFSAPIALALIDEAKSSPPPPLNYVGAGLKAFVGQL